MESYCNQCQGQFPEDFLFGTYDSYGEDFPAEKLPEEALITAKGVETLADAFFCILDIIEFGVTIPCRNIVNLVTNSEHYDADDIMYDIYHLERCQQWLKNYFFGE